jgi:Reverse transcriptase (RNA-dependent DNA polymerase)
MLEKLKKYVMKKINKIKRNDYNRILITETLPYETPIIFSNDGLYDMVANIENVDEIQKTFLKALILGEGSHEIPNSTIPYVYKIKKNSSEYRRLALLHPTSQWKIKCFYEKYEKLILYYCSISPASIRAPNKIAGSFYNKSSWENVNRYQYKNGTIGLSDKDKYSKHTPSFFSYRGFDRLYKFFNSPDYFTLEKKFGILLTLDVSKCFDSIYTHCLSWAVKDKQFTKTHVSVSSTFAQEFDSVIRHGNHNETNGIPIGPEVSRIFSEILFQEIDRIVISRLSSDIVFEVDYAFRRYVDDVFIFAKDDAASRLIYDTYSDVLMSFNLHANSFKSIKYLRPFLTKKSRLIVEASQDTNKFIDKFLVQEVRISLTPKHVHSPWRLTKSYIDSIKTLCSYNDASYDEISSFLISVFAERMKKIVSIDEVDIDEEIRLDYLNSIQIVLEILYFFYSVSPSVSASYKLSTSIILAIRFFRKNIPEHANTVAQAIYDLTVTLLASQSGMVEAKGIDNFIHLESLNIMLAIRELGDHFLLPAKTIEQLFIGQKTLTYFTLVSCFFYIKNDTQYANLRGMLVTEIAKKLDDLTNIFMDCEKTYLLLDMLSCPYIPVQKKKTWVRAMYVVLKKAVPLKEHINIFLQDVDKRHCQVNWTDLDLLNSLEKKELKQAY